MCICFLIFASSSPLCVTCFHPVHFLRRATGAGARHREGQQECFQRGAELLLLRCWWRLFGSFPCHQFQSPSHQADRKSVSQQHQKPEQGNGETDEHVECLRIFCLYPVCSLCISLKTNICTHEIKYNLHTSSKKIQAQTEIINAHILIKKKRRRVQVTFWQQNLWVILKGISILRE